MGLDMYAFAVPADKVGDQQVSVCLPNEDNHEFAYWRKFNNLHGWMERLYRSKGGVGTFNCETVRLMPEDLDRLEQEATSLEPTAGFFFGAREPMSPEDVEEVKDFVARARAAIADGKAVFYDSWW